LDKLCAEASARGSWGIRQLPVQLPYNACGAFARVLLSGDVLDLAWKKTSR
jgi:hypothetical protein